MPNVAATVSKVDDYGWHGNGFNHIVQWDNLFHNHIMTSHLLDETIRWAEASILKDKTPVQLIEAVLTDWVLRS